MLEVKSVNIFYRKEKKPGFSLFLLYYQICSQTLPLKWISHLPDWYWQKLNLVTNGHNKSIRAVCSKRFVPSGIFEAPHSVRQENGAPQSSAERCINA